MNLLIITDCHGMIPAWPEERPDLILLLGDNDGVERYAIRQYPDVPAFGVPGNHDGRGVYSGLPVQDLHGQVIDFNGLRIGGLGGCLRYKHGPWPYLFTEEQYQTLLAHMPPVDIFISHVPPAGAPGTDLAEGGNGFVGKCKELFRTREIYDAHEGSAALRRYVFRMRPKVLFHGHLHQEGEYQMGGTHVVGVFEVITMG